MMLRMWPIIARRASAALTLLAVPALVGLAAPGFVAPGFAAPAPATTRLLRPTHFNVAATHSPRLEHLLAGGTGPRPAPGQRPAAGRGAAPAKGSVLGVDVASGQHTGGATINWTEVAAAGYRFAFIKTTEGSYYANPYFGSDQAAAKTAGLLVAAYHFANPADSSGTLQADFAIDHSTIDHSAIDQGGLPTDGVTLPLIADLEYDPYATVDHTNECYGLTQRQMVWWIEAFTKEVHRLTGQHPVIYTIADWWDKCTGGSTAFAADPLWVASYDTAGVGPTMPAGWPAWSYWQYTSIGKVPGIKGVTDLSALGPTALEVAQPATQSDPAGSTVHLPIRSINASAGQAVSYTASGLPAGLAIDPNSGLITGTLPAGPGTSIASVTVEGTGLAPVTTVFTWNGHGPVTLARLRNQSGLVGSPQLVQVSVSDGLPGCTLSFRAAGLPPGLTMSPCGLIAGWLTKPGSYQVAVTVTDSSGGQVGASTFGWKVDQRGSAGPAGPVENQSHCLSRLRTGTSVAKCEHIAAERWSISRGGELSQRGTCLAAGHIGLVQLRPCHGTSFQIWQESSGGALVNLATGDCLAAVTAHHRPAVGLLACDGSRPQRWLLPPAPITSDLPGWCASALDGVSLRRCHSPLAGTWTPEPDGTLRAGGRCLAIGFPVVVGAPVRMQRCTGVTAQRWQFLNALRGAWIMNPKAGLCLADPADQRTAPVQLTLGACLATDPGVSWRL